MNPCHSFETPLKLNIVSVLSKFIVDANIYYFIELYYMS